MHRDIKPENILLNVQGQGRWADFGASRILKKNEEFVAEQSVSFNSTVAGTKVFMSPEMSREQKNGKKTDIWSLAITFAFLLGLNDVVAADYKGGIAQFTKDCVMNKHDLLLAKSDIYISPILKDLLKNMHAESNSS